MAEVSRSSFLDHDLKILAGYRFNEVGQNHKNTKILAVHTDKLGGSKLVTINRELLEGLSGCWHRFQSIFNCGVLARHSYKLHDLQAHLIKYNWDEIRDTDALAHERASHIAERLVIYKERCLFLSKLGDRHDVNNKWYYVPPSGITAGCLRKMYIIHADAENYYLRGWFKKAHGKLRTSRMEDIAVREINQLGATRKENSLSRDEKTAYLGLPDNQVITLRLGERLCDKIVILNEGFSGLNDHLY